MSEFAENNRDLRDAGSALVDNLRRSRQAPSVLKVKLATLRSSGCDGVVFVCEGVDDKKVYFHWLRCLNFQGGSEFLVSDGKRSLLGFLELLRRDLSGLSEKVFFLVDRDFDGLRGLKQGVEVYLTDSYSIENDLVCSSVLDDILSVDMHCHGNPVLRAQICSHFESTYEKFLGVTKEHNFRIFAARMLRVSTNPLPSKLNKIAQVSLETVVAHPLRACEAIVLEREPTDAELEMFTKAFDDFVPSRHYRGKFAMMFFVRWLELLGFDRNSDAPVLFNGAPKEKAAARTSFDMSSIASRSAPPVTFASFVTRCV